MRSRPLLHVVLTAGIALGLALPNAANGAEDQCAKLTCLAKDPTAANIAAFGGAQAWSRRSGGSGKDATYRLVVRTNGVVADAPIPEFTRFAVDPDLGPDGKGGIVAVYSRCTPKKTPSCDIYRFQLGGTQEERVATVSKGGQEYAPSSWNGRFAFGRSKVFNPGWSFSRLAKSGDGKRFGLFSRASKPALLPRVFPGETDRLDDVIAYSTGGGSTGSEMDGSRIFVVRANASKGCRVVGVKDLGSGVELDSVLNPLVADGFVYYMKFAQSFSGTGGEDDSTGGSDPGREADTVARRSLGRAPNRKCTGMGPEQGVDAKPPVCTQAPCPGEGTSFAVDQGMLYLTRHNAGVTVEPLAGFE